MLSNVSWGEYLTALVILVIVYYFFVGSKYHQKEIKSFLSGKLPKKNKTASGNGQDKPTGENAMTDASFDELEAVVNDLRYAVFERAGRSVGKQELLNILKQRLAKYEGLQRLAYRVAINNAIIANAKEVCGIVFSEYELNSAWDKLSQ